MNHSLEKRTHVKFYDGLAQGLRVAQVPESEITKIIAGYIHEARALCAGLCVGCGAPITRSVDPYRQQGVRQQGDPRFWVQYRCSTQPPVGTPRPEGACDFMVDILEGEAAS